MAKHPRFAGQAHAAEALREAVCLPHNLEVSKGAKEHLEASADRVPRVETND